MEAQTESGKSELEQFPRKLVPSTEQIEQWSKDAVQFDDAKQQIAILSLLHCISISDHPDDVAYTARKFVLANCSAIIDDVIEQTVRAAWIADDKKEDDGKKADEVLGLDGSSN